MPKAERTRKERLEILAKHRAHPDADIFTNVLSLLEGLTKEHRQTTVATQSELIAAARYLAAAITIYSASRKAALNDTKQDLEEEVRFREDQAVREAQLTRCQVDEARQRRADARTRLGMSAKDGKGTPQGDRKRICHALAWAWGIATGQEVPGRKTDSANEPYGEFLGFIRAALQSRSQTRGINADELHRKILNILK